LHSGALFAAQWLLWLVLVGFTLVLALSFAANLVILVRLVVAIALLLLVKRVLHLLFLQGFFVGFAFLAGFALVATRTRHELAADQGVAAAHSCHPEAHHFLDNV